MTNDLDIMVVEERYALQHILGKGGMGMVFQATRRVDGVEVAIKMVDPVRNKEPADIVRRRFLGEAELATSLDHPNIIRAFHYGQTPSGRLFLVMELLEGKALSTMLREPMDPRQVCVITAQLAHAVQAVHDAGVVHRDLKPDNVFVRETKKGRFEVKLLDFGLSRSATSDEKLTVTGTRVGAPYYMAPEYIATDSELGHSGDLYALGAMMFHMLTGEPPFGGNLHQVLTGHLGTPAPKVRERVEDVPVGIDELVSRLLSKTPKERPDTAEQVAKKLEVLSRRGPGKGVLIGVFLALVVLVGALLVVLLS